MQLQERGIWFKAIPLQPLLRLQALQQGSERARSCNNWHHRHHACSTADIMNNFQPHSTTFTHFFLDLDDFCLLFKTLFTHFWHFLGLFYGTHFWDTFCGTLFTFFTSFSYIFWTPLEHFLGPFSTHFKTFWESQLPNVKYQMSNVKISKCQNVKMSKCSQQLLLLFGFYGSPKSNSVLRG